MRLSKIPPAEAVGVVAMAISLVAALSQMWRTQTTRDTSAFSVQYLVLSALAEVLFAVQGKMQRSPTITFVRACGFAYFVYFLVIMYIHRNDKRDDEDSCQTDPQKDDKTLVGS